MSGRSLAYLADVPVSQVKGLRGRRGEILAEAGIRSVADLLLHAPRRYVDRSGTVPLAEVPVGEEITVVATVKKVTARRPRRNLTIVEAIIYDGTSYLQATWFNQPFRARQLVVDSEVAMSGKVERYKGNLRMKSPAVDNLSSAGESLVIGRVVPIYGGVGRVAPGHLRRAIHNALGRSRPVSDPLPAEMIERLSLRDRDRALADIHFPETTDDAEAARERLVFDELFRLEVALALSKQRKIDDAVGIEHVIKPEGDGVVDDFLAGLPFVLTGAQSRAISEIQADLERPHPMHRLLQGEVGSGKTVVALAGLLTGVQGSYQGAVMAPTEVLAEQHYLSIRELLAGAGLSPEIGGEAPNLFEDHEGRSVPLALLTSSRAEVNFRDMGSVGRQEVLDWIRRGDVDLVVGTHALIQEGVHFPRLGVAVVDEQHRFGVHQRVLLKEKAGDVDPDLLIMTATPIPRTLSMTLYGDLDVTLLDEMPPGRPPTKTWTVDRSSRELEEAYELIRREAREGRQAFVVCPLVEDSPKVEAASATAEFERLQGVIGDLRLGLLHGQLGPREKEEVMRSFRERELDVLVSTTVIEVGIDMPDATVMLIEDAHRFGLSQLHQLRGRVGRGEHPASCILITEASTDEARTRIEAMVATTDGFRLAEEDLRIRGQGTVFGARQSGVADLRLADILRDAKALITARREAFALVADDPGLEGHSEIAAEIRALLGDEVEWLHIS